MWIRRKNPAIVNMFESSNSSYCQVHADTIWQETRSSSASKDVESLEDTVFLFPLSQSKEIYEAITGIKAKWKSLNTSLSMGTKNCKAGPYFSWTHVTLQPRCSMPFLDFRPRICVPSIGRVKPTVFDCCQVVLVTIYHLFLLYHL